MIHLPVADDEILAEKGPAEGLLAESNLQSSMELVVTLIRNS
jgi:hypothetical protein